MWTWCDKLLVSSNIVRNKTLSIIIVCKGKMYVNIPILQWKEKEN